MSLARAWRRQLYGASGAALLVPGAMLAALAVLALSGGFARLGALGQVLSGPGLPAAAGARVQAGPGRTTTIAPLLAALAARAAAGAALLASTGVTPASGTRPHAVGPRLT